VSQIRSACCASDTKPITSSPQESNSVRRRQDDIYSKNAHRQENADSMSIPQSRRDELAESYFELIPFEPYPVQQEALLAWFTSEQGVLVCAPTGTGKTLIAEAALFEALHLGKTAYYTTPLIALTNQKFHEMQEAAVRWGFSPDDVGLVTGNRKVNPQARILVVVAEILLNRLLHREAFDFSDVWAVVMDEFHSFNDPERGIVWEFGLGLLPEAVKTLLLSATVGNAFEFNNWLQHRHNRRLTLVQGTERKVPLSFEWVGDELLLEQIEIMVQGDEGRRRTPALIFCFNREQCWTVAEQLKGKRVIDEARQKQIAAALDEHDWSQGAGPKLRQILIRGIGVHHAGILPRYRRIIEQLFQEKLLSICVCTETLAAGINLPARSVVLPTLLKGPPGKMKLIDPASAHQMFGRAGRPQFDDRGFVYALPHEDDVKILRAEEKLRQIPEDTKDPGLLKARKQLKKKIPKRREGVQYWNRQQFEQLVEAAPANLASRGKLPWRLLAYMLEISPQVEAIRNLVDKRLLTGKQAEQAHKQLNEQLITLWRAGYIRLEPKPSLAEMNAPGSTAGTVAVQGAEGVNQKADSGLNLDLGQRRSAKAGQPPSRPAGKPSASRELPADGDAADGGKVAYRPELAWPTESLANLSKLRGVHPLYGMFLMNHLGIADRNERIQALESLLELPRSLGPAVRVPRPDVLPPGPLALNRLDGQLLKMGLATAEELGALVEEEDDDPRRGWMNDEERVYVLSLAQKLHRLFGHDFPTIDDVRVWPVWVTGEVLEFGGDFNKYITSKGLQKQEGMIFRHLLRMILLIDEMAQLCPPDVTHEEWQADLGEIADQIEESCRKVDEHGTEQWLETSRLPVEEI
jgi:superfamily II DNA/RNA helicase